MLKAIFLAAASMAGLATASRNMTCSWEALGNSTHTYFVDISGPFIGEATCNRLRDGLVFNGALNSTWGCSPYSNDSTKVLFNDGWGCQPWIDQAFQNSIPELQNETACSDPNFPTVRNATFKHAISGNLSSVSLSISFEIMSCANSQSKTGFDTIGERKMRLIGWEPLLNSSQNRNYGKDNPYISMWWKRRTSKFYNLTDVESDLRVAFPGYNFTGESEKPWLPDNA